MNTTPGSTPSGWHSERKTKSLKAKQQPERKSSSTTFGTTEVKNISFCVSSLSSQDHVEMVLDSQEQGGTRFHAFIWECPSILRVSPARFPGTLVMIRRSLRCSKIDFTFKSFQGVHCDPADPSCHPEARAAGANRPLAESPQGVWSCRRCGHCVERRKFTWILLGSFTNP